MSNNEYEQQQFWNKAEFTLREYENGVKLFGNEKWWEQFDTFCEFLKQQEYNLFFGNNGKQ